MVGDETNQHPIQVLVSYWKIRPAQMGARLNELIKQGVTHVATFVPWQAVESDISHLLPRFLQAAAERKLGVALILTPEVGVNYPNSGLPKDLVSKPDNAAKSSKNGPFTVQLPPNAFALPSLLSPEVSKRYQNFLMRIDSLLADLIRAQPKLLDHISVFLSGSYWKYYRAPGAAAGDYSGGASVAFRQRMESFYSQREFAGEKDMPAAANRWKTREHEFANRSWFYQQSEAVFRSRSSQFISRKAAGLRVRQVELATPEACPSNLYSSLLQALTGAKADFGKLSRVLDESMATSSRSGDQACAPFVRWTELGGFRTLSDSEKQFLIIKSLLLTASQTGGVLIDESEWFSLSSAFRTRVEALGRLLAQGGFQVEPRVLYLAPHLWSEDGMVWEDLVRRLKGLARRIASVESAATDPHARLLVIDPSVILTRDRVQRLLAWARSGRMVAFPRTTLYTDAARAELERWLRPGAIEMRMGTSFRVQPFGDGKLVVYDMPEGEWETFLGSLLSVAGVQPACSVSDSRLQLVRLERRQGGSSGLFIMNGTGKSVTADLLFSHEVSISDLAASLWSHPANRSKATALSTRFSLEVPPYGVLPVAVDGIAEGEERRAAAVMSELTRKHASEAARGELPGFSDGADPVESLWS